MINDKQYMNWLKATVELINKYNLKNLSIDVKETHPFNKSVNKIIKKDMVHIKIKDVHGLIIDNSTYDILEAQYE